MRRRGRRTAGGLWIGCLLAGAALAQDPAASLGPEERVHSGGLRYRVVAPLGREFRPGGPEFRPGLDLVLCLHGSGDSTRDFQRGLGVLVPELRRELRVFVQSPQAECWPLDAVPALAALAADLRQELQAGRVLLFGYSSGGYLGAAALFERPDVFAGGVFAGSTIPRRPPDDPAVRARPFAFTIGADDPLLGKIGGAEGLRALFDQAGYPADGVRIDVLPGVGHRPGREGTVQALAWVRERLERAPLTSEDEAALAGLEAELHGEWQARVAALDAVLARGRGRLEARAAELLSPLLGAPKDESERVWAIAWLGRLRQPAHAEALAAILSERPAPSARVRAAVLEALGYLDCEPARAALGKALGNSRLEDSLRRVAAEALARAGDDSDVPQLIKWLKAAEKRDRATAEALEDALRQLTGQELSGSATWSAWQRQTRR